MTHGQKRLESRPFLFFGDNLDRNPLKSSFPHQSGHFGRSKAQPHIRI